MDREVRPGRAFRGRWCPEAPSRRPRGHTSDRKASSSRARYRCRSKAELWVNDTMAPAAGGPGSRRGPGPDGETKAGARQRPSRRRSKQGPGGRSPQRSQHCPSGRRASWQEAWGQRPPRGCRSAAQTQGRACGGRRSGQRWDDEGRPQLERVQCPEAGQPPRPSTDPRTVPGRACSRAHLGGAAHAARRVGAGLGAQAQRAWPVEVQAARSRRQESGQVLVARERLRKAG